MAKKLIGTIAAALIITSAGVGTGYAMSKAFNLKKSPVNKTSEQMTQEGLKVGDVIGSPDENTYKDSAEGVIVKGGVDGEGSHHLLRAGGVSQNVYLTSSIMDLDKLDGTKVKVWGETFAAQKAGWLMDVGRAQVLELNAEKPFDEAGTDTPASPVGD